MKRPVRGQDQGSPNGGQNDILNADFWPSQNLKRVRGNTQPQLHSTELIKAFSLRNTTLLSGQSCLG